MTVYLIQAQVSCTTRDGWSSSRQVPTMHIAASDGIAAARSVSDMAWIMSGDEHSQASTRRTYALVVELDADDQPVAPCFWVRVAYLAYGIQTLCAHTYAELQALKAIKDEE